MNGISIGTYDVTVIISLEGLTGGSVGVNLEDLFLGAWLGSFVGIVLGFKKGNLLGF